MKVCKTINILDDSFVRHTLHPGDSIPEWAQERITNPKVILSEDGPVTASAEDVPVTEQSSEDGEAVEDYKKVNKPELIALLNERGLSSDGKVGELRARLIEDDAVKAAVTDDIVDLFELSREQLEGIAAEKGVEFGAETSDEELAALIESVEE